MVASGSAAALGGCVVRSMEDALAQLRVAPGHIEALAAALRAQGVDDAELLECMSEADVDAEFGPHAVLRVGRS